MNKDKREKDKVTGEVRRQEGNITGEEKKVRKGEC